MNALPLPCVCPVAGVSFRPETVAACREGDRVVVRRDLHNAHDSSACAVYTAEGSQLGFLPRALAARIAGDGPWQGEIVAVLRGDTATGLRIRLDGGDADGAGEDGSAATAGTSGDDTAAPLVYAHSGRLLGELVDNDGDHVKVRGRGGATVSYPAHLVKTAQPGAPTRAVDW